MQRLAWLLLTVVLLLAPAVARAQSADEALADLASPSFDTIRHGVELLAFSGDPRAAADHVSDCRPARFTRARPTTRCSSRPLTAAFADAATGKAAPDVMASGLKQVRMNNPVRGAVEAALGSLRLFAPDAATRLAAAEAVFHSHDPAALPALDKALAQGDRCRGEAAHGAGACGGAAVSIRDATEHDRLAAVAVLRARGDLDSRSTARRPDRSAAGGRDGSRSRGRGDRSRAATLERCCRASITA